MYKLCPKYLGEDAKVIFRIADNVFIPFDPANTDYQTFKREVLDGAELQDADGNVMTAKQAQDFLKTLP